MMQKKDEYQRQFGEFYYRCKIKDNDGKDASVIIRIPNVLIGEVEIVTDYNNDYTYSYYKPSRESYMKFKIEHKDNIVYEIIMEDKMGEFTLGAISDIKFIYQLPKFDHKQIKDVIYNNPATIVLWKDGTKTVVKCQKGDTYNPELGLAMCIIKKMCDNKGNYNDVFNKWLPKEA